MNYKLLKKQNYFHALFDKKGVEVIEKDGQEIIKISGYASTIDKDRVSDVVLPSAFVETLSVYKQNPVILLQHKMDKPIGKATDLMVDEKGLRIEAEISEDLDGAKSAIKNGVLKWFSIGYKVKEWEEKSNEEGQYWEIKELELLEISVVSVPANPFTLIKSLDSCFEQETKDIEESEEVVEEEVEEKQEEVVEEEVKEEEPTTEPWDEVSEEAEEEKSEEEEETKEEEQEEEKEEEAEETKEEVIDTEHNPEEEWCDGSEKEGENPSESEEAWESQEEPKGLQDMSMKMMLKRLEDESWEIRNQLSKDLSETLEKALGNKADSIKSEIAEDMNSKFVEYAKGQMELYETLVDTIKTLDQEMTDMLALVKAVRSSKGYNFEKPAEAKAKKQDALSKALESAKKHI